MKHVLLTGIALCAFALTATAQSQGGNGNSGNGNSGNNPNCAENQVTELKECLDFRGVSYSLVPSMATNVVYLFVDANTPPGKITSCKQQYLNGNSCPDAPAIVESDPLAF